MNDALSSCEFSNSIQLSQNAIVVFSLFGIFLISYCMILTYFLVLTVKKNATVNNPGLVVDTNRVIDSTKQIQNQSPDENNVTNVQEKSIKKKANSYRIEQEQVKKQSSEFTRRGVLWSTHASWHLPLAPRYEIESEDVCSQGLEHILELLKKYDVDPCRGFLPKQDPLQRLPYARYHLW